jgi:hypothetical protein
MTAVDYSHLRSLTARRLVAALLHDGFVMAAKRRATDTTSSRTAGE